MDISHLDRQMNQSRAKKMLKNRHILI